MDDVQGYVSVLFILTTIATVGFLFFAIRSVGFKTTAARLLILIVPLWLIVQAVIGIGGFYQRTEGVMPPRLALYAVLPALLLIAAYFVFFSKELVEKLPLKLLTLLHVIRIPVELVLYSLFVQGAIPEVMTFAGRNYDILSGILAVVVYLAAFRNGAVNRKILIAYNILGLILLANIVTTAVLSLPTPMQQLAFEQPNRAVLYFPYVWLPSFIVPTVLFSHLAALWQLFRAGDL
ncbi:MAG: hypothetical protein ACKVQW_14025 [Pyrinomonadaceae bacterium]